MNIVNKVMGTYTLENLSFISKIKILLNNYNINELNLLNEKTLLFSVLNACKNATLCGQKDKCFNELALLHNEFPWDYTTVIAKEVLKETGSVKIIKGIFYINYEAINLELINHLDFNHRLIIDDEDDHIFAVKIENDKLILSIKVPIIKEIDDIEEKIILDIDMSKRDLQYINLMNKVHDQEVFLFDSEEILKDENDIKGIFADDSYFTLLKNVAKDAKAIFKFQLNKNTLSISATVDTHVNAVGWNKNFELSGNKIITFNQTRSSICKELNYLIDRFNKD